MSFVVLSDRGLYIRVTRSPDNVSQHKYSTPPLTSVTSQPLHCNLLYLRVKRLNHNFLQTVFYPITDAFQLLHLSTAIT